MRPAFASMRAPGILSRVANILQVSRPTRVARQQDLPYLATESPRFRGRSVSMPRIVTAAFLGLVVVFVAGATPVGVCGLAGGSCAKDECETSYDD
jgi:hypothetical protein